LYFGLGYYYGILSVKGVAACACTGIKVGSGVAIGALTGTVTGATMGTATGAGIDAYTSCFYY
jgi:hypothetical protein